MDRSLQLRREQIVRQLALVNRQMTKTQTEIARLAERLAVLGQTKTKAA